MRYRICIAAVLVLAMSVIGALGEPRSAHAATVEFHRGTTGGDPGYVAYRGEPGEANQVKIDYLKLAPGADCLPLPLEARCLLIPNRLTFSDAGAPLIRPDSYEALETLSNCIFLAVVASCPLAADLIVNVGQGADSVAFRADALTEPEVIFVSVLGGPGNDRLSGTSFLDFFDPGSGRDWVDGGPNDDFIVPRDGEADVIRCGAGTDQVNADSLDQVAPDCELVQIA
jgi:hypothetical protein